MLPTQRASTQLLIVFIDLTRFAAQAQRVEEAELAETIDHYYEIVAEATDAAGGTVVKFIGDAALVVFPADGVDAGIEMLLKLKVDVDHLMTEQGWECRLHAKAHFGAVIAGPFGSMRGKRFDVLGRAVNTAAVLDSTGVALSAEAFRKLSPPLRQKFRKHTPSISYLRLEDPRPSGRGRA